MFYIDYIRIRYITTESMNRLRVYYSNRFQPILRRNTLWNFNYPVFLLRHDPE